MRYTAHMLIASATLLATMTFAPLTPQVMAEEMKSEPAKAQSPSPFGSATALDITVLGKYRGGTDLVLNDMKLNGVVTGNQAFNLITGTNTIGEGAFAGAAGLPIAIQNSGNNVLIQNATIVNVQIK